MIRRLYDGYVDRVAAGRGVGAFFKWFLIGALLQAAFMIPALAYLIVGVALGKDRDMTLAADAFVAAFLCVRAFLLAAPCMAVARRKGLPAPAAWAAGGLLFGPITLGLAAALTPARAPAAIA